MRARMPILGGAHWLLAFPGGAWLPLTEHRIDAILAPDAPVSALGQQRRYEIEGAVLACPHCLHPACAGHEGERACRAERVRCEGSLTCAGKAHRVLPRPKARRTVESRRPAASLGRAPSRLAAPGASGRGPGLELGGGARQVQPCSRQVGSRWPWAGCRRAEEAHVQRRGRGVRGGWAWLRSRGLRWQGGCGSNVPCRPRAPRRCEPQPVVVCWLGQGRRREVGQGGRGAGRGPYVQPCQQIHDVAVAALSGALQYS